MTTPMPLMITVDNGNGTTFTLSSNATRRSIVPSTADDADHGAPYRRRRCTRMIDDHGGRSRSPSSAIGRISLARRSIAGIAVTAAMHAAVRRPGRLPGGRRLCRVGRGRRWRCGQASTRVAALSCNVGWRCRLPASGAGAARRCGGGGDPQISNRRYTQRPAVVAAAAQTARLLGGAVGGGGGGIDRARGGRRSDASRGSPRTAATVSATGLAGGGGGGAGGAILLRSARHVVGRGTINASTGSGGTGGGGADGDARRCRTHSLRRGAGLAAPSGTTTVRCSVDRAVLRFAQQTADDRGADAVTLAGPDGDSTSFSGQAYDKDLARCARSACSR